MRRHLGLLAIMVIWAATALGGCSGASAPTQAPATAAPPGPTSAPTPPPERTPSARPSGAGNPTPGPTAPDEWPVVRTSCPDATGDRWLLVAIGTSESAGPGEYPEQYADILCDELDAPVELHGYYPTEGLAPLAWWIRKASSDDELQADLAAANEVVLWAMSSHDLVPPLLLAPCGGQWPEPLRSCFQEATAQIAAETDELFGLIRGLVRDGAPVLASDAYAPPAVVGLPWFDEPYGPEISRMVDPYYVVEPLAAKHGFTLVDTEVVFNGQSRRGMPPAEFFGPDGLHPSPAGARRIAQVFAAADGIGN